MKVKISTSNSKLGPIPNVNLPTTTCRADAPCKKGCYARKYRWLYSNVQKCLQNNLDCFVENPNEYFNQIINYLNKGIVSYRFFRYHSSGEIINYTYLLGMIRVANECPQTTFLCYTKKFNLVNLYLSLNHTLPDNLKIVYSMWDKDFKVDNPYGLPVSIIDFKDKTKNVSFSGNIYECPGKCDECQACWHLQNGQAVLFHQH